MSEANNPIVYRNKKSGAPVDEFALPEAAIQIQDQLSDTNGRIRDTKVPFITALDDEDTPEDLEVFGVRSFLDNLYTNCK